MGIEFNPYEDGDVFAVRLRDGDPLGSPVCDYPGPAWSLKSGDEVLMCFGIHLVGAGSGMLWAFFSDEARGHGLKIIKFAKPIIDGAFEKYRYHRIQAIVRADREEYQRFIELFGFEKEGLMRQATANRQDIWLYSRVLED